MSTQDQRDRWRSNKRRRSELKRREVSDKPCGVPGCEGNALFNAEDDLTDCCYAHSLQSSDTDNAMHNDGIIDDTAIDLAVQGARDVNLTWVEKDIVMALMLMKGYSITQARERVGVSHQGAAKGRRSDAVLSILAALKSTRNGWRS